MNVINVLPQLSLSAHGPVNELGELVHFRQGDLDGACGPYSLLMALVTKGVISRSDAVNLDSIDGRKRLGRFRNRLLAFGGLICEGTDTHDLSWLSDCFRTYVTAQNIFGTTRSLTEDLVKAIDTGSAPIIGVEWGAGDGHWLLVIGYQKKMAQPSDVITHLLCLDPFVEGPVVSLWNAVIEVQTATGAVVNAGRFPSNHWYKGDTSKCKISNALVIANVNQN